jgi:hypothetical protein
MAELSDRDLFYTYTQAADELLRDVYIPGLKDIREGSLADHYLMKNLKTTSEGVHGTRLRMKFRVNRGIGWRPVHPRTGTFPSGGKTTLGEQEFRLAMYGAGIQLSLEELENLDGNPDSFVSLMDEKLQPVFEGWPYFKQACLRSPQSGILLVADQAESSLAVRVDNAGLWNTVSQERTRWITEGMYLQWYRGTSTKVGSPVMVTYVDHDSNLVYLAESRGVADNDFAVMTTIDGREDGYWREGADPDAVQPACNGIYNVLAESGTFQGVDRDTATNYWARARCTDMSAAVMSKTTLRKWLREFGTKRTPVTTSVEVLDYLFTQLFATNERFMNTKEFKEGYESVSFDGVPILAVPDGLSNSIDRVDFDEVQWVEKEGIHDPHGQGWYPLPKGVVRARDFCAWANLFAKSCRTSGRYHNFVINTTMGA